MTLNPDTHVRAILYLPRSTWEEAQRQSEAAGEYLCDFLKARIESGLGIGLVVRTDDAARVEGVAV